MTPSEHEFDRDTRLERIDERLWRGAVSEAWNVWGVPNGGFLLALALRPLIETSPHPDPIATSAHYLEKVDNAEVDVEVEVLREGRGHSTYLVRVRQAGTERMNVVATMGDLGRASGPTHVSATPPDLPPLDECLPATLVPDELKPEIVRRFDPRVPASVAGWAVGAPTGTGEIGGYLRFVDGREPDAHSLALISDAFPPAIYNVTGPTGWVPTLELGVQVRQRPAPGWLRCWFTSRNLVNGYVEEDGEIWDSEGRLVALSRQLARVLTPKG